MHGENSIPNNLAALPHKDGCKNSFYRRIRLASFRKNEKIFWQRFNGISHFRQRKLARPTSKALAFDHKKRHVYMAKLESLWILHTFGDAADGEVSRCFFHLLRTSLIASF